MVENHIKNIRPRIRLTNFCNGNCPYCFAKSYIESEKDYITLDNSKKLLSKLKKVGVNSVAWQGGEPLIHPNIIEIIKMHIDANMKVSIFTNGLFNHKIIDLIQFLDFDMLININHPAVYHNPEEYQLLKKNIEIMVNSGLAEQITLGINYYTHTKDFSHIYDLIQKYKIKNVRLDMARPASEKKNQFWEFKDITNVFKELKEIIQNCISVGAIYSHFDCPFPICELEKEDFTFYWRHMPIDRIGRCYTDVDVGTDLQIMSCYCSKKFRNIYLDDFDDFNQCYKFIKDQEEVFRWEYINTEKCEFCELRKYKICQGGCLGYRKNSICIENREEKQVDLLPYYKLFYNRNNYDIDQFISNYQTLSNYAYKNDLLNEINHYYALLCLAEINVSKCKLKEAKKNLIEAFKNVHYLDVDYIILKLKYIETYLQCLSL